MIDCLNWSENLIFKESHPKIVEDGIFVEQLYKGFLFCASSVTSHAKIYSTFVSVITNAAKILLLEFLGKQLF